MYSHVYLRSKVQRKEMARGKRFARSLVRARARRSVPKRGGSARNRSRRGRLPIGSQVADDALLVLVLVLVLVSVLVLVLVEAKSRTMPAQCRSQPSSDGSAAKVNHLGPKGLEGISSREK